MPAVTVFNLDDPEIPVSLESFLDELIHVGLILIDEPLERCRPFGIECRRIETRLSPRRCHFDNHVAPIGVTAMSDGREGAACLRAAQQR